MLLDVEVEEVAEMRRDRRRGLGNQVRLMADNVQDELEKEPAMHRLCCDLTTTVSRTVGDSSTVLSDWKLFADGLIVS